jgi:hypothetical protein
MMTTDAPIPKIIIMPVKSGGGSVEVVGVVPVVGVVVVGVVVAAGVTVTSTVSVA